MKILFIIARSPYDDYMGGAENFVKSVGDRLSKRHEVHLLTRKLSKDLPDEEVMNGIHIHRYSFLNLPTIRQLAEPRAMYKAGLRIVREHDIDVVCPSILYPTGYVGVKIAKETGKPSLLTLQNEIFKSDLQGDYAGKRRIFALKNATRIHVVSKFLKESFPRHIGRPAKDITVIYNGVDTGFFSPDKVKRSEARKKYAGSPLISCISHFKPSQKKQDLLVRAMGKVVRKYPDAMLLLVGEGDSSYARVWVDRLGLSKNVRFLGYQPPDAVRDMMGVSDILAFITAFEGMGIVAVEALAMGTPVVATDVGPLPELVRQGVDGRLTSLEVDDIADGIIRTLSDRKMKVLRKRRIEWVRKNFSWDTTAKKIEKELLSLCGS
jgi:glycosyltransferase involved in cell wall biosynthesis